MNVLICWSGQLSQRIAEELRAWLPRVIPAIEVFFSPEDIHPGKRWAEKLAAVLEESQFGLLCLTEENVDRPWISFEAGALSKHFLSANICPVIFSRNILELRDHPLAQFQSVHFHKSEIQKLTFEINKAYGKQGRKDDELEKVFVDLWPELKECVTRVLDFHELSNRDEKITRLNNVQDWYTYVTFRIESARKRILDTGFGPRTWGVFVIVR